MNAFREDMKKMLTKAGGSEEHTVFLFSDTQIKDEGFVEDVNNLLNTGEIPNLFPAEERVAICFSATLRRLEHDTSMQSAEASASLDCNINLGSSRPCKRIRGEMVRKAAADEGKAPAGSPDERSRVFRVHVWKFRFNS
ncbi:DNAH3 [Symbiodinium microadriaticum]|nr:DNAH3 [Symbiodinium microadriaticum]